MIHSVSRSQISGVALFQISNNSEAPLDKLQMTYIAIDIPSPLNDVSHCRSPGLLIYKRL